MYAPSARHAACRDFEHTPVDVARGRNGYVVAVKSVTGSVTALTRWKVTCHVAGNTKLMP
jgi:ATP-dependent RNA circularization protein (DNA/RNA ligase family)